MTRNVLWSRASVCACVSVCLSAAVRPHYCTDSDVTWASGRGCPLVVQYWADLQSVHWLRCYGNITWTYSYYKLASTPRYDDMLRTRNVSECLYSLCAWFVSGVDAMRCCSGIECADCVMNLDQYRAVTKTELDIADHSDTAGDAGEMTSRARHKHGSNHRSVLNILDSLLANQIPAKGVVTIVCRIEIRKMAEC